MNTKWQNIIGHKMRIAQLQALQSEDRMPHAMLFCGMEGIGKRLVAEALAAVLLCQEPANGRACGHCPACQALDAGTHPDFFVMEPEATGKAAKSIKIEAVRELQSDIARVPMLSARRVVLIDEAEKMNEAAANCLLKTIEEPSGQAVFILVTSKAAALLDTIISRCMRVEFGVLDKDDVVQVLTIKGIENHEAERLASIADGSVGKALSLQDAELLQLQQDAFQLVENMEDLSPETVMARAKSMSEYNKEKLVQWLIFLAMIYRDMLVLYSSSKLTLYNSAELTRLTRLLPQYSQTRLLKSLQLVQEYQKRLRSNVNLQLCMEGFFIKLRGC